MRCDGDITTSKAVRVMCSPTISKYNVIGDRHYDGLL